MAATIAKIGFLRMVLARKFIAWKLVKSRENPEMKLLVIVF
jgi:hypothetical protein